jgi:hypothetical protein
VTDLTIKTGDNKVTIGRLLGRLRSALAGQPDPAERQPPADQAFANPI